MPLPAQLERIETQGEHAGRAIDQKVRPIASLIRRPSSLKFDQHNRARRKIQRHSVGTLHLLAELRSRLLQVAVQLLLHRAISLHPGTSIVYPNEPEHSVPADKLLNERDTSTSVPSSRGSRRRR